MRYASSKLLTNVTAYTGFSARGGVLYLTPVITLERLSHLTALSSALDNYMTTHFVHRWFHLELSCETGQCAKKFWLNRTVLHNFYPLPCCPYLYIGTISIPSLQLLPALNRAIFTLKRPLPITFLWKTEADFTAMNPSSSDKRCPHFALRSHL